MRAVRRICSFVFGLFIIFSFFAGPAVQAADSVRAIVISGEIDGSQAALVQRGLELAEENGDRAVVISIDTMGGRVDSALKIRDMLRNTSIPTIAFIQSRAWSAGALIALSCRHIVMAPGSSIGAAEPIPNTEKNIAAVKSEFSATASHMGHNPHVAEAMVDKTDGYPGYAEPGKILSLSDVQARELDVAEGTANSPEEALKLFSLGDAAVLYEEKSWKDSIIGMLQNEYVRMVIIACILVAIFVEIKTAGIGVGIITAVILGSLLFLSGEDSLGDSLVVLGMFIGSLFFVALEILSPGMGVFGVLGVLLLFGSLFYTLGATVEAVYILAGGTVLAVVVFYIIGKRLPASKLAAKFTLTTQSTKEKGYSSQADKSKYLHQRGKTITILRPAGTIRIGKDRVDAVSAGSFIERDVEVRVVEVEGTRVVVEPIPKYRE